MFTGKLFHSHGDSALVYTHIYTHAYKYHIRILHTCLFARMPNLDIGRVSLARENEAGGSWGQKVHILHVNV